jgi:thymidylate synthase
VGWKSIIKELLWFLRGDTDAKILQAEGVHIWDGNTSREFLDSRGLSYEIGVLGPGYGWQFRHFGAPYSERFADTSKMSMEDKKALNGTDQLAYIEELLDKDPFSRRMYINLWNAHDLNKMALTPCHVAINFYVDVDEAEQKLLSAHVYIRSNDLFLGNPYNIFSYTVLVYLLAWRHDMKPANLVVSIGDAHIYKDHLEQVKLQLSRDSFPPPKLELNEDLKTLDWSEIKMEHFKLTEYKSHPSISAKMSV